MSAIHGFENTQSPVGQSLEVRLDERLTDRSFLSVDFSASFY
jgi:hypothetical protein